MQQQTIALPVATAHASAQLMQLRETKPLGVLDHHDRRVGHVDADFDHRSRHQNLQLALGERCHHSVFLRTFHSPMQQPNGRPQDLRQMSVAGFGSRQLRYLRRFDQRANPINLRSGHQRPAQPVDHIFQPSQGWRRGLDRLSPGRFFGELGNFKIAVLRHQQRARDRRRRHRQHVDAAVALGL